MNIWTRLAVVAFVTATSCGCERVMTYDQINKAWHGSGATVRLFPKSVWYYQGSDDLHHYFVRHSGLFKDKIRSYRVDKTEIAVRGAFPLTQAESEWKRVQVRFLSIRTPGDDDFPKTLDFAAR